MSRLAPADHPRRPYRPLARSLPRRDPHGRLMSCIVQIAGEGAVIDAASSRPWASATFNGSRHSIDLRFDAPDAHARAASLAETLPEADFAIPGFIVADLAVDAQDQGRGEDGRPWALLRLSALVIEDW